MPTHTEILKDAEASGRAVSARFQSECPNLCAHLPVPSDEEQFAKMIEAVRAYAVATTPSDVLTFTLFARGLVNGVRSKLFKFREFAPESVAGREFAALVKASQEPLPYDGQPEKNPQMAKSIRAIFTNI